MDKKSKPTKKNKPNHRHKSGLEKELLTIFNDSQTLKNHAKLIKQFMKLYEKWFVDDKIEEFLEILIILIKNVLTCKRSSPFTKRTLDFIALLFKEMIVFEESKENERLQQIASDDILGILSKESDSDDDLVSAAFDGETTIIDKNYLSNPSNVDIIISNYLLDCMDCDDLDVRTNSVNLIRKILASLEEIEETTFLFIEKALQKRSFDKDSTIRAHVVLSLKTLQNVEDNENIIRTLEYHLQCDPDHFVRLCSLKTIDVLPSTLKAILASTRDSHASVRCAAYEKIANNCTIENFSCKDRNRLIRNGINDTEQSVQDVVFDKLIANWIVNLDGDLVTFLDYLDFKEKSTFYIDLLTTYFQRLLKSIKIKRFGKTLFHELVFKFKEDFLEQNNLIKKDCLRLGAYDLWYQLCDFCKKNNITYKKIEIQQNADEKEGNEKENLIEVDLLDDILPDIPIYCDYVEDYYQQFLITNQDSPSSSQESLKTKKNIFNCLLKISTLFTIKDEAQWNRILKLFTKILKSDELYLILEDYIVPIYATFENYFGDDHEKLLNLTLNFINEINNPDIHRENDTQSLNVNNNSTPSMEIVVEQTDLSELLPYSQLSTITTNSQTTTSGTQKLNERINSDSKVLERCLEICYAFLYNGKLKKSNIPLLPGLINRLVLPNLACKTSVKARLLAIKNLGYYCFGSLDAINLFLKVFIEIINEVNYREARVHALKSVFDFICFYGLNNLKFNDVNDPEDSSMNGSFNDEMNQENFPEVFAGIIEEFLSEPPARPDIMKRNPETNVEYELFETSIKGLCKAFQFARLHSDHLFAQLIMIHQKYQNISLELKQFLKMFFYSFKKNSKKFQEFFDLHTNPFIEAYLICFKSYLDDDHGGDDTTTTNQKKLLKNVETLQNMIVEFIHLDDRKFFVLKIMEIFELTTDRELVFLHLKLITKLIKYDQFIKDELLELQQKVKKMRQRYFRNGLGNNSKQSKSDKAIKQFDQFLNSIQKYLQEPDRADDETDATIINDDQIIDEEMDDENDIQQQPNNEEEEVSKDNNDDEPDNVSDFE